MLEWGDLLFAEGSTDRDREMESGIQHTEAAFVPRLQAACPGGLYSPDAPKLKFTGPGCDVNSLTRRGTKTRAGHPDRRNRRRCQRRSVPFLVHSHSWIRRFSLP